MDLKTPLRLLARLARLIGAVLKGLFGSLSWQPPAWLRAIARGLGRARTWQAAHRGLAAALYVFILGTALSTGFAVRWYRHRPRPVETHVTLTAPALTDYDQTTPEVHPLVVEFDRSAAPLKNLKRHIEAGIRLDPPLAGSWTWQKDRRLVFMPKEDWPVGQKFSLRLAKKGLVAPHVQLSSYELSFASAPFAVTLKQTEFYQDPVDASLKKVVATFDFSHPVDPASFERRVKLHLTPSDLEIPGSDFKFRVTYDKRHLHAYVHSAPVAMLQKDATMQVTLEPGTQAERGGPAFAIRLADSVTVPGLFNFLKISSANATVVDNAKLEPDQLLVIETSAGVSDTEVKKNLSAWLLPLYDPTSPDEAKEKQPHSWDAPTMVGDDLLRRAQRLPLTAIAGEQEFSTLHSFKFQAPVGRYLYLRIQKGMRAFGGYLLGETFDGTTHVPPYPAELKLLHEGALLSMSGDKRVGVYVRDLPGIETEVGRVLPSELANLFTQSDGPFAHPQFYGRFDVDNLADVSTEIHSFSDLGPGKPHYETIDLSKYFAKGERRGLFLLKVRGYNPETRSVLDDQDSRLVLVSDLGIVAKRAADDSRELFVQSIVSGEPVSGAKVEVIGKNGLPVTSATTDATGDAHLPPLKSYSRAQTPVLYLVQKGADSSLLPMKDDRQLDFSRFDVGGATTPDSPHGLSAYLFTDRGVYRPGEEIRGALIVRSHAFDDNLTGVPIQVEITDARGLLVEKKRVKLDRSGFAQILHTTPESAATGTYSICAYIVKDGAPSAQIGSTTVRVREFLPDRMKISLHLSTEKPHGWVSPTGLKAEVTLANLFGTPAANHKVRAILRLTPALPSFARYPEYRFFDASRVHNELTDTLPDVQTGADGSAELDLNLARFAPATYRLSLLAEGFEAEGGRSVTTQTSAVVSPFAYLIGIKADGDLSYIDRASARSVSLIAVGPDGSGRAVSGLRALLYEERYVSALARQPNGTYKYQSVKREIERASHALSLPARGLDYKLPTDQPGSFELSIRDSQNHELQRLAFNVAGAGNLSRSLEKNAELELALKKSDVDPGQDLELQIRAPYTGSGLITVERDKVYAHRWFKTSTTSSIQTIRVPSDFEGGGYVSVTFVRDPASREIFMSPLSYGVLPFSVSRGRRVAKVVVKSPELARPGAPYRMHVTTDRPAKVLVMAVDEGILQVTHFATPDPLGFFFRKQALGVTTTQILDLILPSYARLLDALAPGGDAEGGLGSRINPFRRRHEKPVAYWSGIVDVGPHDGRDLVYDVPDSFSGTLRVMAVAVAPSAVGTFEKTALIRGDFVLTPTAPSVMAPGDEADIDLSVANNVVSSGAHAEVTVGIAGSPGLTVLGPAKAQLQIAALREQVAHFRVRATQQLGSASLHFTAALGGHHGHLTTDVSVRPAMPHVATVVMGQLKKGSREVPVSRSLYPERRSLAAGISALPLELAHGLAGYLNNFPHGCTEQITSQTVPAIVLGGHPEFGFDAAKARAVMARYIATLRNRQNGEGGFGLWAANPHEVPLISVYAMNVLTEAKERGFDVPADLLKNGLRHLQSLAASDGDNLDQDRVRAYAIYVLTRNGMMTGNYVAALERHLQANDKDSWQRDLAGSYLAATYKLLHEDRRAEEIIDRARFGTSELSDRDDYDDPLAHDGQLLYLLARQFPRRAVAAAGDAVSSMIAPLSEGHYNTYSSAQAILGLEAYGTLAAKTGHDELSMSELVDGQARPISLPDGLLPVAPFSDRASAIRFSSDAPFAAFYVVKEAGFPLHLPTQAITHKIEVYREYTDATNHPVDHVKVGDQLEVHVRLRALGSDPVDNIAIVDLLPGGFETVVQPPPAHPASSDSGDDEGDGEGDPDAPSSFALPIALPESTFAPDYGDVREDRVVLYGAAMSDAKELVYDIQATNVGSYTVPPIQADSMYDRTVFARGLAGHLTVTPR